MRRIVVAVLACGAGAGLGVTGSVGQAQVPGLPTSTAPVSPTAGTEPPPPPAPPVTDPGPPADATTHVAADPARRGAVAANGLRPPLRSLWRQDLEGSASQAVVGDGRVYVIADGRVLAFELATGRPLWTSAAQVRGLGLAYGGGKVVTGADRALLALDAATGAVAWSISADLLGGSPLIAGDLVVVQDQGLAAYDLATGAKRWEGGTNDGVDGSPAAAGDRIFQIGGCTIVAVDRRDGRTLWSRNSGCSGGGSGTVTLFGDRVLSSFGDLPLAAADGSDQPGTTAEIVAGDIGLQRDDADIAAVSLSTGTLLWRAAADDSVVNGPLGVPLVVGDTLLQTRFEGTLQARALQTGAVTWEGRLRPTKAAIAGSSSGSDLGQAAGGGVLIVLRGSTIDALTTATEPPAPLRIAVPSPRRRAIEAGTTQRVSARAVGDLWPAGAVVETDPFPFEGRFRATGRAVPFDEKGAAGLGVRSDRNVRIRVAGAGAGATSGPSRAYTLFAFPRIRIGVRNVDNRVRARIAVTGSRALRFRGRRVHLYIVRAPRRRMIRLASNRLGGPPRRTGRATVSFRALDRVGRRDYLFACVPGVHRLGQGAGDRVQRRCGRASITF